MATVSSTYALRGLRSEFEKMSKDLRKVKNAVENNTIEFKKINDEIAENKRIKEREKPDWREVAEPKESEKYPLVQTSQKVADVNIQMNLKKLNIL